MFSRALLTKLNCLDFLLGQCTQNASKYRAKQRRDEERSGQKCAGEISK
jgi:hypothetical protein